MANGRRRNGEKLATQYKVVLALEEDGRARAADPEGSTKTDEDFLVKVEDASNEMANFFRKFKEENFSRLMYRISSVAGAGEGTAHNCTLYGRSREKCVPSGWMLEKLEQTDQASKEAIGKKCTWMYGDPDFQPYTWNKILNDLTACFHRGVEKFGKMSQEWHKEGKCMWKE